MTILDANVLIYAYDRQNSRHARARAWLESLLSGDEEVALPLISILAFLRILSNPTLYRRPLSPRAGVGIVETWLERPNVRLATPSERHWPLLEEVSDQGKAHGALLMDAHLAALALEYGGVVATTDAGMRRFVGVRVVDPLA